MAAIQFTDADRDDQGFIKAPARVEPRSLADLLPATSPNESRTPALTRHELISAAAIVPLLLLALLYISSGRTPAPPAASSAPAATVPTVAPLPTPIVVLLDAYAAPDGAQLGPIEATRAITAVAHFGADWIQADVSGSGLIWLRASDWPQLAIVGPDLAPRPTDMPHAAPAYVEAPPPPPAPTQCAIVGVPGRMVSACGYDELGALETQARALWLATYGGTIGTVDHPTPQIIRSN